MALGRRLLLLAAPALAAGCAQNQSPPPTGLPAQAGSPGVLALPPRAAPPASPPQPFVPSTAPQARPAPEALAGTAGTRPLLSAVVGDGPALAMILAEARDGAEQWLAPGPFVLGLRAGRIARSVNLPGRDLRGVIDETPDPLARPQTLGDGRPYRRRLQVAGAPPGGLVVEGRLALELIETLPIPGLGQSRALRRVRETGRGLEGPVAGWRFENLFWIEPGTGRVLASRQVPLPDAPTVAISVIRPG